MAYPEKLLKDLTHEDRMRILSIVRDGGYKYNKYGECLLSQEDADEEDYSQYFTPEEIEQFRRAKEAYRRELLNHVKY